MDFNTSVTLSLDNRIAHSHSELNQTNTMVAFHKQPPLHYVARQWHIAQKNTVPLSGFIAPTSTCSTQYNHANDNWMHQIHTYILVAYFKPHTPS